MVRCTVTYASLAVRTQAWLNYQYRRKGNFFIGKFYLLLAPLDVSATQITISYNGGLFIPGRSICRND